MDSEKLVRVQHLLNAKHSIRSALFESKDELDDIRRTRVVPLDVTMQLARIMTPAYKAPEGWNPMCPLIKVRPPIPLLEEMRVGMAANVALSSSSAVHGDTSSSVSISGSLASIRAILQQRHSRQMEESTPTKVVHAMDESPQSKEDEKEGQYEEIVEPVDHKKRKIEISFDFDDDTDDD